MIVQFAARLFVIMVVLPVATAGLLCLLEVIVDIPRRDVAPPSEERFTGWPPRRVGIVIVVMFSVITVLATLVADYVVLTALR